MSAPHKASFLLDLPAEILVHILQRLTTPSFIQTTLTCHRLFDIAATSREVILHHLCHVPGIKLGLADLSLHTIDLFLILRQRAAASLHGANFHADCQNFRFRNGTIDPNASCLADLSEDISISLVLKESSVVRSYGTLSDTQGLIQHFPPPDVPDLCPDLGNPVQVVHWKTTVSVLYESRESQPSSCPVCEDGAVFHSHTAREYAASQEKGIDMYPDKTYHLVHYSCYADNPPDVFYVSPPEGILPETARGPARTLKPLQLIVHSRLKCAILWSEPVKSDYNISAGYVVNAKRSTSQVILYSCERLPTRTKEAVYNAATLCPIARDPDDTDPVHQRSAQYMARTRPRGIQFAERGEILKLYRAGSITPYALLQSPTDLGQHYDNRAFPRLNNEVHVGRGLLKMESPFFGQHIFDTRTSNPTQTPECLKVYLHLATSAMTSHSGCPFDVFIVQNRIAAEEDDCDHIIDLDDQGRFPYDDLKVVARLWGYNQSLLTNSTLTAVESVCVSPKGTRIAIACWNQVLVWPLHPDIFCEEWVREGPQNLSDVDQFSTHTGDSDNGDDPVNAVSNTAPDNSDTHSSTSSDNDNAEDAIVSASPGAIVKVTRFYDLVRHPTLGEIVELKPIVLKLPEGAVVRKMMWSRARQPDCDDDCVWESDVPKLDSDQEESDVDRKSTFSNDDEAISIDCEHCATEAQDVVPTSHSDFATAHDARPVKETPKPPISNNQLYEPAAVTNAREPALLSTVMEVDDGSPERHEGAIELGDNGLGATTSIIVDADEATGEQTAVMFESSSPSDPLHGPISTGRNRFSPPPILPSPPPYVRSRRRPSWRLCDEDTGNFFSPSPEEERNTYIRELSPVRSEATSEIESSVPSISLKTKERAARTRRRKRDAEDQFVVLTDRGVQYWDLGVWATGKREKSWFDEKLRVQ